MSFNLAPPNHCAEEHYRMNEGVKRCRWCSEPTFKWKAGQCSGKYPQRGLLDLALDVHMSYTGSYERSEFDDTADRAYLQWRLDNWEENLAKSRAFDDAVKNLVRIALAETFLQVPSRSLEYTESNKTQGDVT